jgi:phosphopantetheinyl transferase
MYIYYYDAYRGNRTTAPNTEQLISLAINRYVSDANLSLPTNKTEFTICRTQKGKPYLDGFPGNISVSHSDHLWVCSIGSSQNGIDIQNMNHSNYEAISHRFFQPDEQEAVNQGGIQAFMAIWCRKEAFIKYHGLTIGDTIDWLNVAKDGCPQNQIEYMDQQIYFSEIQVAPEYLCVVATSAKEMIWVKKLQVE